MYQIEKNSPPAFLHRPEVQASIFKIRNELSLSSASSRQRHLEIDFPWIEDLTESLLTETQGRCAYCEQAVPIGLGIVDHYRPMRGALDSKGRRSEDHYTWLAYEWSNLFACCEACSMAKGAKFPVVNRRFSPGITSGFEGENALILCPSTENVHQHFNFLSNGSVDGRTYEGRETIAILKLNRPSLVHKRQKSAHAFLAQIQLNPIPPIVPKWEEFRALRQQLLTEHLQGNVFNHDLISPTAEGFYSSKTEENHLEYLLEDEDKTLTSEEREESAKSKKKFYETFPLISRIHITNCFGFSELDIHVPENSNGMTPWLVLLGENGVGKSSILKAIALALAPAESIATLGQLPEEVIHDDASEGAISIFFDTQEERSIFFKRDSHGWHSLDSTHPTLLLGYGATRLLPDEIPQVARVVASDIRVKNLFNSFEPLLDAWSWLSEISDYEFDYAARALKDILNLDRNAEFYRADTETNDKKLLVRLHGKTHPLKRLSEGYKGLIALSCDIMSVMFQRWETIENAQGIVLIDELENHLHPTWKMKIVGGLRRAFPRVQFIVSTHEPLCLRGLQDNEVVLLRRSNGSPEEIEVISELPNLADMRVDQILTSPYFGLRSTVDPSIQDLFDEYYALLQREKIGLTEIEKRRLHELQERTRAFDQPALMDRDRIVYKAIDTFLAERTQPLPLKSEDFDAETQKLIQHITALLKN